MLCLCLLSYKGRTATSARSYEKDAHQDARGFVHRAVCIDITILYKPLQTITDGHSSPLLGVIFGIVCCMRRWHKAGTNGDALSSLG
mgnify:CR=1 FL=1